MLRSSKSQDLLTFEIAFYERLVREHPDFTDALMALGDAYTRRGWYEKGLAVDEQLTRLKGDDPIVWYNLACSYSLLGRIEQALEALRSAITLGYDDFASLQRDPDLQALRQSPQFRIFLKSLAR